MQIETHRIKKKREELQIYKKFNNPNEVFSTLLEIVFVLGGLCLSGFGIISIWSSKFESQFLLNSIVFSLVLGCIWFIGLVMKSLIIQLKRQIYPIVKISNSKTELIGERGEQIVIATNRIRGIKGRMYKSISRFLGESTMKKQIYYSRMFLQLDDGNEIYVYDINTSKLFHPIEAECKKELSNKLKRIGSKLSKELGIQAYIENNFLKE